MVVISRTVERRAFHSGDLGLRHVQKSLPFLGSLDLREHLGGVADRRQRIFELVRHVGRERLHEADAFFQPAGRFLERAGEIAELVGSIGPGESTFETPSSIEKRYRFTPKSFEWAGDGSRNHETQHHGDRKRDEKDLEDRKTHFHEIGENAGRGLGDEHRADDLVSFRTGMAL